MRKEWKIVKERTDLMNDSVKIEAICFYLKKNGVVVP